MYAATPSWPTVVGIAPSPGLLFGLMLLAAVVGGYSARFVHVPRVVGFFLGGVVLRALLHAAIGSEATRIEQAAEPLAAIEELALGLILFAVGGVFERSRLRAAGPPVLRISVLEIACSAGFVFAGCLAVALLSQPHHPFRENLVLALLLGAAAIATAPAATLFVLQEYESRGPITDTIHAAMGFNNVVCIVLFYTLFLILASAGVLRTAESLDQHLLYMLTLATLGSVAIGVVCGTLLSIAHAKLPVGETLLIFFTLFVLLGSGEKWLLAHGGRSYNFLLTSLVTGAVFSNVAIDAAKLAAALRTLGAPIFAGFFVMAGYGLHLDELAHMGWIGGVYVVCRCAGKVFGCTMGVRWAGAPQGAGGRLGGALLCQAAVVIGLASFVERYWDSRLAQQFSAVVLGSVVLFELAGPLLLKRCIVQGGEVKLTTLLRRTGGPGPDDSIVALTLQSLLRLVGWRPRAQRDDRTAMSVEHIMRTNVRFIPAAATLDEVLHFIERSTESEFPVVDETSNLVGMIHFRDIRDVIYDPSMRELVAAVDLADPDATGVPRNMVLSDLLNVFTTRNVSLLPVVDRPQSRRIVGVVEQRDLLHTLHRSHDPGA